MKTVKNTFVVEKKENQARIGKSSIMQPEVHFNGKGIKWFDDSQLIKKEKGERREIYQPHWQKSWKARLPLRYRCLAECRSQRV